jgi:hypothetical protein
MDLIRTRMMSRIMMVPRESRPVGSRLVGSRQGDTPGLDHQRPASAHTILVRLIGPMSD